MPAGWVRTNIGDACQVIMGQSPPGSTYNEERAGLPFFQGKAEFGPLTPTPRKWCTAPTKVARSGDVLISVRAPVGPSNLSPGECCIGRGLAAIRPGPLLSSRYLLYALRESERQLAAKGTGTTFQAISGHQLRAHPLRLAPRDEQDRIVAEIEKQFTRLDASVEALKRLQAHFRRYRAAVLKAACGGQLLKHQADLSHFSKLKCEGGAEYLSRLDCIPTATKPKNARDSRDVTNARSLPLGWVSARLGQLAPLQAGYAFPSASFRTSGVRLLKGINVRDGWIAEEEVDFWNSDDVDDYRRFRLNAGDVVLAMDRPVYSSGSKAVKVARLGPAWDGALLLQRVGRFQFIDDALRPYIQLFLHSPMFRAHLILSQSGSQDGKDLPHVSAGVVDAARVPLPPLREQRRIVSEVEMRLTETKAAETAAEVSLVRASRLRAAILRDAFIGRLVPQASPDVPAAEPVNGSFAGNASRPEPHARRKRMPA